MKIVGIGNAIIDVICKIDYEYLNNHNLTKGSMKLVDKTEFDSLIANLKIEETISGGSVANSIVGLSQLGNQVGFIGKVNNDDFGLKYERGLKNENVNFLFVKKKENIPTGTCLVLLTPDSERTMCTYLGIAGDINENDIDEKSLKESKITFLEGYLWDKGNPKSAFMKAIKNSNKIAMTLSDVFCVERHKSDFLDLVKNKLDIVFANENEMTNLINADNFDEVVNFTKNLNKISVITRGEKGAMVISNGKVLEIPAEKNLNIIDLTGAGDLFASGFLHGYLNSFSLNNSLKKGVEMSSKIIQILGARLRD